MSRAEEMQHHSNSDRYVTLAIHTQEHALALKRLLEIHGIEVRFEKLVVTDTKIVSGIRVKINEHDLPLALRITEEGDKYNTASPAGTINGHDDTVLIPVDFKPYSLLACRMGFEIAQRLSLHPVIVNSYLAPYFTSPAVFDADGMDPLYDNVSEEMIDIEVGNNLLNTSRKKMRELRKLIDAECSKGTMPDIKYSCKIEEGVPEDVIKAYCRASSPAVVVMATRCKQKKGEELVGSVTAEVLDSCRVPVFSIPENGMFAKLEQIKRLVFFCNLDQQDIISIDTLMRMFDYPEVEITLIPLNEKGDKDVAQKIDSLKDYCNKCYPASHFTVQIFPQKTFLLDFENYEIQASIDMIVVPNKRRNFLARILNPGIAHRLLFERDLPLLALPV